MVKARASRTLPVSRDAQTHQVYRPHFIDTTYVEPRGSPGPFKDTAGISGSSYQLYPEGLATIQERVSLILCNFIPLHELGCESLDLLEQSPRFCGSWVTALPELIIGANGPFSECLYSAVTALALSITAYRTREKLLGLVSTQYEHSLRLLGLSLEVAGNTFRCELVAAVMCLALVEVMLPDPGRKAVEEFTNPYALLKIC